MTPNPKGNPAVADTLQQRILVVDVTVSFRAEDVMEYEASNRVEEEVYDEVYNAIVWTVAGAVTDASKEDPLIPAPQLQEFLCTVDVPRGTTRRRTTTRTRTRSGP